MQKEYIGVFDSGFGGLTILQELKQLLPEYSYIYLGDNARAPYGNRSFDTIYKYTLQAVKKLFELNCTLVIIACNTASAKALRTIQQKDLPLIAPHKRVLGVIRPSTEQALHFTKSNNLGIFATVGTVNSGSYEIEIQKLHPQVNVYSHACPMWVPLVENGEAESEGADYFIKKDIDQLLSANKNIDAILLACTHYPLLIPKILKYVPPKITIINQGKIVAESLYTYLQNHKEIETRLAKNSSTLYYTTEKEDIFNTIAQRFYKDKTPIEAMQIAL